MRGEEATMGKKYRERQMAALGLKERRKIDGERGKEVDRAMQCPVIVGRDHFYSPARSPKDSIRVTVMGSLLPGNRSTGGEESRRRERREKRTKAFYAFSEEEEGGGREEGTGFDW